VGVWSAHVLITVPR